MMSESYSFLGRLFSCFFALFRAHLFGLMRPFKYQVCTQYKEARIAGEWDVIFIGVIERVVEEHPNFPAGKYVWQPVRTYWGKFNNELRECNK